MTTASILPPPRTTFIDSNGVPLSGGKVYTYIAPNTSTPKTTWQDANETIPNSNPIILDSAGTCLLYGNGSYYIVVTDSLDNLIWNGVTSSTAALGTLATQNANAVAITGGTIDGTVIGGTTPAAISTTSINGGQLAGFRNKFINGDFSIWQRGTAYSLTTSSAYGTADRWAIGMQTSAAATANQSSASVPTGFRYCLQFGRNNGSALTNYITLFQALETANSIAFQGTQVTLSFYAKAGANFSGSALSILLQTGTGVDQSAASQNSWTGVASPIAANVSLTQTWTRYSYTATLSSTETQIGLEIYYLPSGTAGADDNVYLTGVQLEPGSVATPFEFRLFGTELNLCQRYYQKSFDYATTPAQASSTTNGVAAVYLPTGASGTFAVYIPISPMRAVPTIITYNPISANANWRDFNTADRTASIALQGTNGFLIAGASGVAGSTNFIHWSAQAEL